MPAPTPVDKILRCSKKAAPCSDGSIITRMECAMAASVRCRVDEGIRRAKAVVRARRKDMADMLPDRAAVLNEMTAIFQREFMNLAADVHNNTEKKPQQHKETPRVVAAPRTKKKGARIRPPPP